MAQLALAWEAAWPGDETGLGKLKKK